MEWDARLYERQHAYIWQHGASLLEMLNPQPGERILDLGCGTGHLTRQIADAGAAATGLDRSAAMVAQARQNYPGLDFVQADAADFRVEAPFDAVFSHAALHWVKPPERAAACVFQALKPGGRFVADMGARGNIRAILDALRQAFAELGRPFGPDLIPWYFPSLGQHASLLEQAGFHVYQAMHFPRPTPLDGGEAGMHHWLSMFAGAFFAALPPEEQAALRANVVERLRPSLYRDGAWVADYVRLRFVALKPG